MPRVHRLYLFIMVTLASGLLAWGVVSAAPVLQPVQLPATPTPLPIQADILAPDISFISSPTAACQVAQPNSGLCNITWSYLYAYADPNYMITMTVSIDNNPRARYNGFFQTYMFVPSEMLSFQVACGPPGASGHPDFGFLHAFTLRARDSASLTAANYGSVLCPINEPYRIFLPLVRR